MPGITNLANDNGNPKMGELKVHNSILGDHSALATAWERDGYWFFKNVLDKNAVASLRSVYIEELLKLGVVDVTKGNIKEGQVYYNGAALDTFPRRMEPLMARSPWPAFVADPAIHAFFKEVLGDDPFWVPTVEYRATPPALAKNPSRFDGIHQDGPYSPSIPFRICWIPLANIDEDVGGLGLVEGMTEQINRHPVVNGSNKYIPTDAFPMDRWKRATYEAGDVLLMNLWTPHSGLSNVSSRFRLSMDHRLMAMRDRCPLVGIINYVSTETIILLNDKGETTLRLDADTYIRSNTGMRLYGEDVGNFYQPGTKVIVAHENGLATVVRPQQG